MNFLKHPRKILFPIIFLFLTCILSSVTVFAQSHLATIEGTVVDEEDTPLPGATVTVRNVETGYFKSGITQADGRYIISGIQPGKYECEVSLSGFATHIRRGMTFPVGARLTIDFTLSTATIEEEVTVTAESPMVEVTKSEISTVVDRKKIDDLPLLDRNFDQLTILKAGVLTGDYGEIRANAQPRGYEEMVVDGVSNENTGLGANRSGIPADAIQEFRILTNQFEAEFGNASGLLRSVITRSGTNEFRGRLNLFYRDDTFDDVSYFVNHAEYQGPELPEDQWEKPPYEHYRFGGFLGGPIQKDKAHFFIVYEGLRHTDYTTITCPLVPRETFKTPSTNNQILGKISYQANEKNLLSFRYSLDRPVTEDFVPPGSMYTKELIYDSLTLNHSFQANWTFYPTDSMMNEFRFQYSFEHWQEKVPPEFEDVYLIVRPSGAFGSLANLPQWNKFKRYQFVDNLSLFFRNHSVKIGIDLSYCPWRAHIPQYMPGMFIFQTDEPFDATNPATYPFLFIYNEGSPDADFPYWEVGVFAQDSWKIHPQVTLNFGLRYNYYYSEGSKLATWNIRNLNPRFGFSWDPVGDGKTSVRGGIGTYSANPLANPSAYTSWMSGIIGHTMVFPNYPDPFQPNPFFPPIPGIVSNTVFDQKDGQVPSYTLQTTIGFEREFITDFYAGVDFAWARGYRLMYQHQSNPVIPGTYFIRPNPAIGDQWTIVDWGKSDYKGLYLTFKKRYSHGWSLEVAYTLSKAMTDTEDEFSRPVNYEDLERKYMWGPSNLDARHRLNITGIVDLPLGFQMSGLLYYRSALPWNALYATDVNADGLNSDYVDEYRNSRRGFDQFYLNVRLSKYINISGVRLRLFAEGYNITNRVNYMAVFNRQGLPLFGKPTAALDPRLLQFGVRFDF